MRVAFALVPRFLLQSHEVEGGPVSVLGQAERERVVLVEGEGGRARVVAASSTLQGLGVRPAMTVSAARSRVGEVWAVPFEPDRAVRESARLAGLLLAAGPHLGMVGRGAYWIGADGWRLLGGETALMARITAQVQEGGYSRPQVGVADRIIAARAAAVLDRGRVPPGQDDSFLAPLPLTLLPLEPSVRESLRVLNIRTVGAFAALPAGQIADRFGAETARTHRLARGEDPRPLGVHTPEEEQRLEVDFETAFEVVEPVLFVLQGGLPALLAPHVGRGFGIQRLQVELVLVEGIFQREIRAADAVNEPKRLLDLCWAALREAELPSMIQGVRLSVLEVAPAVAHQGHLWTHERRHGASLDGTLARLQGRLGAHAVRTPGPVQDSPLPEAAASWLSAQPGSPAPWQSGPGVQVMAAWRLLTPPSALFVQLTDGLPRRIRYQGQWRPVCRLGGPQRIETGWWESALAASSREYWYAELESGPAVSLYRDLGDQGWYLQGILD